MHIEQLYNKFAKTYNQDTSGKVLDKAKRMALELTIHEMSSISSILALGMGDGTDLLPYVEHYPQAELYGLDISENMLARARGALHCTTYHGDIEHASSMINKNDFSFVIAHFVTAYVPLPTILREAKKMLASGGNISVVTNTMGSFPVMQSILPKLKKSSNPIYKLVAHHVNKTLKTVFVPQNLANLRELFELNGFKIKALEEKNIEITLSSEKEIFDFFINGGWFVSGLMHPLFPHRLIRQVLNQVIHKYCPVPFEDSMKIAIAIAEPRNVHEIIPARSQVNYQP